MATEETTVTERGMVRIPDALRGRLDIEAGDTLRWVIDDEGELTVEVVKQRHGAFDDFEAVPMGAMDRRPTTPPATSGITRSRETGDGGRRRRDRHTLATR